jgi:intracellular multiplication protein IcmF
MVQNEPIEQFHYHLNQIKLLLKASTSNAKLWTRLFSKHYLYEQPWTLVIGTPHSGKTAFLQQAELNLIQGSSEDNLGCNTWFSQEGVFIEIPSVSLENSDTEEADNNYLIQHFLQTIKTHRHKKPFDNILLTINLVAFIHDYDRYMQYLENLKKQLQTILMPYLSNETGLYIVFTHMDRVAGFCDFFSDFSSQHQTQALGYLLEDYSSKKKLIEQHEKKYDRLLSRLHENLVTLLHKTRNNLTRYLIREFPQQLESLRNMVRSSVSLTADIEASNLKVKGIFFTSACQSGLCIDRITLPISQAYQLTLPTHFPQARKTQPYFIKGITKMIAADTTPRDTRFARYQQEHKVIAYAGGGVVGLGLLLMGIGYYSSVNHIEHAASNLQQYQAFTQKFSQDNTIQTFIPELEYLANARQSLHAVHSWFIPLKAFNKTKHWINSQYKKTLSQQFLPQLAHQLEEQLLHETNPALQYATLKAYLMLGEPQFLELPYLKNWLYNTLHLSSEKALDTALLQPFPGITLNTSIIEQVRNNLNVLPCDYLVYMIIKNNPPEYVPFNNNAFTYPLSSKKGIPNFYTRIGFEKTYNQTIPTITQKIIKENWILKNPLFSSQNLTSLTHQIQKLYITDYLNWWQLFIYHTQPKSFSTLVEAAEYFKTLTETTPSPFIEMLTFIQSNTRAFASDKSPALHVFNTQIAAQLKAINTVSTQSMDMISPIFKALSRYFAITSTANNRPMLILNTAKQRFQNPRQDGALNQLRAAAHTMPAPLNQWLEEMAGNTWYLIISEAKNTINEQWKKQILPQYTQNITNRFPLNTFSEQEISLENFSRFFNNRGTLQLFFEEYLKPFLDTSQAQWVAKKVDNTSLPFKPETIATFERANIIREMFFPQNAEKPFVSFTLQSTDLQPIVKRIIFDINGQALIASQSNKTSQAFTWPGDYTNTPVTLTIQSISGENFQATEYGAWGLFRLLSHANAFPISQDTRKLELVLDINGNAAQYLLQASNPVNPFIPNILQGFELSQDLF